VNELVITVKQSRDEIVNCGRLMKNNALVVGTCGNISMRVPATDQIAITPSGVDYDKTKSGNVLIVDMEGNIVDGDLRPSIELPLHLSIYRAREDVNAIVHTHSTYCAAFAIARKCIPATAEDLVQIVGGEVRVSEYCLPGSAELGEAAVKSLEGRNAVLLANHGCLSVASSLDEALKIAMVVEKSAQANLMAQLIGGAVPLNQTDIDLMKVFYHNEYGQR
jgi:L-fuculose-phosphate aldolase